MPELPTTSEIPDSSKEVDTSLVSPPNPEVEKTLELNQTQEINREEIEIPLPPVLQSPEPVNAQTQEAVAAPSNLIQKGKTVSELTNVAIKTFAQLQKKLAIHYQTLREKVGGR